MQRAHAWLSEPPPSQQFCRRKAGLSLVGLAFVAAGPAWAEGLLPWCAYGCNRARLAERRSRANRGEQEGAGQAQGRRVLDTQLGVVSSRTPEADLWELGAAFEALTATVTTSDALQAPWVPCRLSSRSRKGWWMEGATKHRKLGPLPGRLDGGLLGGSAKPSRSRGGPLPGSWRKLHFQSLATSAPEDVLQHVSQLDYQAERYSLLARQDVDVARHARLIAQSLRSMAGQRASGSCPACTETSSFQSREYDYASPRQMLEVHEGGVQRP